MGQPAATTPIAQPLPPSSPNTKLEAFAGSSGNVYIKGYSEIGKITHNGSVTLSAMTIRNAQTGQQQSGILIETKELGRSSYLSSSSAFIDYDEIQGLIEGLSYIASVRADVTDHPFFEARYSTRGGFEVTVFNDGTEKRSVSVKTSRLSSQSVFLIYQDLVRLKDLVIQCRDTIDNPSAAKAAADAQKKEKIEAAAKERAARAAAEQASRDLISRPKPSASAPPRSSAPKPTPIAPRAN